MEAISFFSSNPIKSTIVPSHKSILNRSRFNSSVGNRYCSSKLSEVSSLKFRKLESHRCACIASLNPVMKEKSTFDVVIVGAGIIGLTIARQLLLESKLSVAVVDAGVPCSGATGAGQGYIWMCHKTPGSPVWDLSMRSKQLWEVLAESVEHLGMDPLELLGWKKTGSLLIGRTLEELNVLENKVKVLSEAGLRAEFLSRTGLHVKEPAVEAGKDGAAALILDDCQLDAQQTVAFIEKGNRAFASQGRYAEFYHDPAVSLLRSDQNGEVEAVQTSNNILYSRKAVVIATGAWSGSLMQNLLAELDVQLDVPVKPRKGHLLVLENFPQIQLNHGLMEVGYANHEVASHLPVASTSGDIGPGKSLLSISMTATMDRIGNLVLGSSRQFVGFNTETEESIVNRIWERAGEFFPALRDFSLLNFSRSKVRIGLRPYMHDGKPLIGPIPGLPNVLLATGHEGGGLCMALGTAEMVADMVLGNTGKIDETPFSIQGRC